MAVAVSAGRVTTSTPSMRSSRAPDTTASNMAWSDGEAVPPSIRVVCAQNGVENERQAARWFAHVYGMCVMLPATHLEPGVVVAHSAPITGLLDVGRYPYGVDDVAIAIADDLSASTF